MDTLKNRLHRQAGTAIALALLVVILLSLPGPVARAWQAGDTSTDVIFVENSGQFADLPDGQPIRFRAYGSRGILSLVNDGFWLTVLEPAPEAPPGPASTTPGRRGVHIKVSFAGANPEVQLEPFQPLDMRVSYFRGGDPANWQAATPTWGGVRYVDLYPGLDLEITGQNGQWLPHLVVKEGAPVSPDPAPAESEEPNPGLAGVRLRIEGAEALDLADGQLHLSTAVGGLSLPLLQLVSPDQTLDEPLPQPQVEGTEVAWPFGQPVETPPLASVQAASDLLYSSFLGGSSGGEAGRGIAADESGSAYVTGNTVSADFPVTPGAFDVDPNGGDAFVAKFTPDGSSLAYATFLGGGQSFGLAVDGAGSAYVTGRTFSEEFPATADGFGPAYGGGGDAFIAKLGPSGDELVYAGFLGGGAAELATGVAVDVAGRAYVTGFTASADFPVTAGALNENYNAGGASGYDTFVARINETGSSLVYATFLGGSADDTGEAIAVDEAGNAYVTGETESLDFPVTPGAFDPNFHRVFVAKLDADGAALVYATFLGGNGNDTGRAIAVDQAGSAYVAGDTTSNNLPTTDGAFQPGYHSGSSVTREGDAYVVKFSPAGDEVAYATYLGGTDHDVTFGLAIDAAGHAYVTGSTYSADFPVSPTAFQPSRAGYPDAFVSMLNAAGSDLAYGTFLGGNQGDAGYAIAANSSSRVYVTGYISSADFPVTEGAFDTDFNDSSTAFVASLAVPEEPVEPTPTPTPITPTPPPPTPIPSATCAPALLGTAPVGNAPRGIAVNPDQNRVYVANYGSNSVMALDGDTLALVQTATGIPSANGLAYDPGQGRVWVTNTDADQVTPLDAATLTALPPVAVGDGAWGVAYDPIHNYVYVANSLANSVSIIDAATASVVTTLTADFNQPFQVVANPLTGKVYVANFGGHTVTVLDGTTVSRVVDLYDSSQPYGLAVDELRNIVYVSTVGPHRIVAIGPIPNRGPDQFLGWAAFYRGFGDRHRPLPMRAIAVNPAIGPAGDGGHLWTTTTVADGSEAGQALFIPKGWGGYFHFPIVGQNDPGLAPEGGLAIDRIRNRVYVASGSTPGTVAVLGDHPQVCPVVAPAEADADGIDTFDFDVFSAAGLTQGDVNGDGQVNIFDLSLIAARYGTDDPSADVNGDGQVSILDLAAAASNFGQQIR